MTLGWRSQWTDFIRIWFSELAAATFIRQHVLRWSPLTSTRDCGNNGQSIAAASRRESEKLPGIGERAIDGGDADSAGDWQEAWRTATSVATARRAYGQTDGRRGICQVVGDGQVVRRPRWVATNVWRLRDRTDEFYHYSDGSPTMRSIKQWDGNRAVGRPKTDGGSLVKSEDTTGGNEQSIELSHGRFVACHKTNFHIKPEKGGRLIRGSCIFSIWGENLGVDLYVQSTCTRLYTVLT